MTKLGEILDQTTLQKWHEKRVKKLTERRKDLERHDKRMRQNRTVYMPTMLLGSTHQIGLFEPEDIVSHESPYRPFPKNGKNDATEREMESLWKSKQSQHVSCLDYDAVSVVPNTNDANHSQKVKPRLEKLIETSTSILAKETHTMFWDAYNRFKAEGHLDGGNKVLVLFSTKNEDKCTVLFNYFPKNQHFVFFVVKAESDVGEQPYQDALPTGDALGRTGHALMDF